MEREWGEGLSRGSTSFYRLRWAHGGQSSGRARERATARHWWAGWCGNAPGALLGFLRERGLLEKRQHELGVVRVQGAVKVFDGG